MVAGCLLLGGCIATVPHAEPAVLAAAQAMFPSYASEELEADRAVFVQNCRGCHTLTPGKRLTVSEWPEVIDKMQEEVQYEPETGRRILRYLQTSRLYWEAETVRIAAERQARREARSQQAQGSSRPDGSQPRPGGQTAPR